MSEFFESTIVQDELNEINQMQKEIYGNMMSFADLDLDDKMEHIDQLTELLEKQKVMYTRLSLSNDPQAIEMKEKLQQSVTMLGFPEGTDMSILFEGMRKTIESLKQNVDQ
tara:strand:+ start:426 stop:758 length:333 start_codon:yes stop_codon:yes gene_type:complete